MTYTNFRWDDFDLSFSPMLSRCPAAFAKFPSTKAELVYWAIGQTVHKSKSNPTQVMNHPVDRMRNERVLCSVMSLDSSLARTISFVNNERRLRRRGNELPFLPRSFVAVLLLLLLSSLPPSLPANDTMATTAPIFHKSSIIATAV